MTREIRLHIGNVERRLTVFCYAVEYESDLFRYVNGTNSSQGWVDQDKLEADFFLGLFHIKAHEEKLGLHHWRNIQELKDTGDLLPDILNEIYLSLFMHFLDHYYISEAQDALGRIKPGGNIDLDIATLYLQLQKGHLEAKANNYEAACREWERALSIFPSNWMLNQNLALAKTLLGKEDEAANHFNVLVHELEKGGEKVSDLYIISCLRNRARYTTTL